MAAAPDGGRSAGRGRRQRGRTLPADAARPGRGHRGPSHAITRPRARAEPHHARRVRPRTLPRGPRAAPDPGSLAQGDDMTIPARFAPLLFSALLSAIMVAIVSAFVLTVSQGIHAGFGAHWLKSCLTTWPVAF